MAKSFTTYKPEWLEILNRYQETEKPIVLGPFTETKARGERMSFYRWRTRALDAARDGDPLAREYIDTLQYLSATISETSNGYKLTIEPSALSQAFKRLQKEG